MYPKNVYDVDLKLGGGEFSLSACPGVGNRPPRKKGNCKSTAGVCLREGGGGASLQVNLNHALALHAIFSPFS